MASIDANTLNDPTRVRRTVLAQRHNDAKRMLAFLEAGGEEGVVDKAAVADAQKALDAVAAEIQAEYADDPGTEAAPEPPKK